MVVAEIETEQESLRRHEFRRMVAISAGLHLFALGLAVSRPAPRAVALPQAISVEIVSDPSAPPKARVSPPKPAPVKPAPPEPAPPKPKKTVLPAKPVGPKPEAKKPVERRKEVFLDPAPREEKSLEDLLADMREEQGEPTPAPAPAPTQTAVAPMPGAQTGVLVSPEIAAWMRRAKVHVKRAWTVAPGFRMQSLQTHVSVRLDAGGNVVGDPEITRRSGNPWYDETVLVAFAKASPLPAPPGADTFTFVFDSQENF